VKRVNLKTMTVVQLVEHFMELALHQYRAEIEGSIGKYNRIYEAISAVTQELKSRAGDQRAALAPLFVHPNPQVRLVAAQKAFKAAPAAARQVFQDLSDRNIYPQAAYARQSLWALDGGESKLLED
jgi:hypothetical protein